jgi:hypothetical protein
VIDESEVDYWEDGKPYVLTPWRVDVYLTDDEYERWTALADFWKDTLEEFLREVLNSQLEESEALRVYAEEQQRLEALEDADDSDAMGEGSMVGET